MWMGTWTRETPLVSQCCCVHLFFILFDSSINIKNKTIPINLFKNLFMFLRKNRLH
ncbi:hypothetical protein AtNW77_Chr2g0264601 [Arabidopsis thaliana]